MLTLLIPPPPNAWFGWGSESEPLITLQWNHDNRGLALPSNNPNGSSPFSHEQQDKHRFKTHRIGLLLN